MFATSTESFIRVEFSPPTTINLLSDITAAKHKCLGVNMWLITSQHLRFELYLKTAVVDLKEESRPPMARSWPQRETHVDSVTGRSAIVFHTAILHVSCKAVLDCNRPMSMCTLQMKVALIHRNHLKYTPDHHKES